MYYKHHTKEQSAKAPERRKDKGATNYTMMFTLLLKLSNAYNKKLTLSTIIPITSLVGRQNRRAVAQRHKRQAQELLTVEIFSLQL